MSAAARIARQQQAAPVPRRDLVGRLLLTGMDWTNANPWFGVVGAVLTIVAAGVAEKFL